MKEKEREKMKEKRKEKRNVLMTGADLELQIY